MKWMGRLFQIVRRAATWLVAGVMMVALAACGAAAQTSELQPTSATGDKIVHIGYQKYGTLNIVKAQGQFDKTMQKLGYKVEWTEFPGGPQLLEALRAGSIDIGHAGEAPPIFAQAGNTPFVYLGHEPSSPHSEAMLVPENSTIHSVQDLKGKKIALNKGSNVHYLLVKLLQSAGLQYQDIQPVYLAPADARAAFQRGSVDAWVIWDPYYAVAQTDLKARVLVDGQGHVANQEFYFASKRFEETHKDVVQALIKAIGETDAWSKNHRKEVAQLLAPQLGIDSSVLEIAANRRDYGFQPMDAKTINEQQQIADTFQSMGLIPNPIRVADDVDSRLTEGAK